MTGTWTEMTEAFLDRIWEELSERDHPRGGHPGLLTLATTGADGGPELRQLILRKADRATARLTVFTDAATPKVAQIRSENRIAVLLWNADAQLQIRARGSAEVTSGAGAAADWVRIEPAQRGNYGTQPVPGTPIASADGYRRVPDPERLAIIDITLDEIDAVHLGRPSHRRAVFSRQSGWAGEWVAP